MDSFADDPLSTGDAADAGSDFLNDSDLYGAEAQLSGGSIEFVPEDVDEIATYVDDPMTDASMDATLDSVATSTSDLPETLSFEPHFGGYVTNDEWEEPAAFDYSNWEYYKQSNWEPLDDSEVKHLDA